MKTNRIVATFLASVLVIACFGGSIVLAGGNIGSEAAQVAWIPGTDPTAGFAVPTPTSQTSMPENENYHPAVIEFLSEMTTIFFTFFPREISAGQFLIGWIPETHQPIITNEVPEIYFSEVGMGGFFDRQRNQIHDAPWIYARRGDGWVSWYFANSFKLFDIENDEMPVIFIHFNQTFDGGYAGFYRLFRYVDGEYRMLEMRSFANGVRTPLPWIGYSHIFFRDSNNRLITFVHSPYHSASRYEHLTLTDEHADLHLLVERDHRDWEAWERHHWMNWGSQYRETDGWMYHNPVMFNTNTSLTLVEPLHELHESITASIMQILGL